MIAGIISDTTLEDGILNGFNADGVLVVSLKYMPVFQRLLGAEKDEKSVKVWHVSPGGARRVAAISAWNTMPGNPTSGSA